MAVTDPQTMTRVASRDGTPIAYWTSGDGPPLVLVHGAPADHTRWRPLLSHLEPHATVHAVDRRGRGASGDAPAYRLRREFEDIAAVVDAVARASGRAVDLYGHSFGGLCAFGAATLTPNVRRLALYEGWPPADPRLHAFPPGVGERLDALLDRGDHDAVVEIVLRELAGVTADDIAALRAQPSWQARAGAALRITREVRAIPEAAFDAAWVATVTAPTLLLTGADSRDPATVDVETIAGALPDARIVVLERQEHVADIVAPGMVAEHLIAFLREDA